MLSDDFLSNLVPLWGLAMTVTALLTLPACKQVCTGSMNCATLAVDCYYSSCDHVTCMKNLRVYVYVCVCVCVHTCVYLLISSKQRSVGVARITILIKVYDDRRMLHWTHQEH